MITVKMRAHRTHFYRGKILTMISEITAIGRGAAGGDLGDM
jgi:hypothetical protein